LAQLKKVLISLPDNLLKQVDSIVSLEKTNRSEFVRQAMKVYIRQKYKLEMKEKMKKGYQQMAEINLKLAELCFDADEQLYKDYHKQLAECE
jgi:CopG family transcriptional regulator/antitoxin EndoAI